MAVATWAGCTTGAGGGSLAPPRGPSALTHVSEPRPVSLLAAGGAEVWCVTPAGLRRASVDGSDWTDVKGLVEEGEQHPFTVMAMDGDADLWLGGRGMLAEIGGGRASRFAAVEKSLGSVTALAESSGGVHAAGGAKLATRTGESWTLQVLPFEIHAAVGTQDALWLAAGAQGIARVQDEMVEELPDPLGGDHRVRDLAARADELWALWVGDDGGFLTRLENDNWHVWTVPQTVGGLVRLSGTGSRVLLQTDRGLFELSEGQAPYPLAPLMAETEATAFGYISEPMEVGAEDEPAAGDAGSRDASAVPPLDVPAGHKYTLPAVGLVPVDVAFWSEITALGSDGDLVVVGTRSTGTYVLDAGEVRNVITPYEVRPRVPMTSFSADGRFYYVLAEGRGAGVVEDGEFRAERLTTSEQEELLALDRRGYAVSLAPELETLRFFEYRDGTFVEVMERPVEIASGIGDVGGFLGRNDGSFWFTIVSATENLEMGVGAVHPALDHVVYHGSVPMPPDQAVAIPNGVRHIVVDDDGDIWLGGMEGAVMLDGDLNATEYGEAEGLVGDMVTDMVVDEEGRIWALTVDGLGWFEEGSWRFPHDPPYRGGIISCLGLDAQGRLLLADQEAVRRHEDGRFDVVIPLADLPGMEVLDVTAGAEDDLWVVTERAVTILPGG